MADLNGDGFADAVVVDADPDDGNRPLVVCMSNGDGTFKLINTPNCDSENYGVAIGDYDGDGIKDLAVAGWAATGKPGIHNGIWVLPGNGDGTFRSPITSFPNVAASLDFHRASMLSN